MIMLLRWGDRGAGGADEVAAEGAGNIPLLEEEL